MIAPAESVFHPQAAHPAPVIVDGKAQMATATSNTLPPPIPTTTSKEPLAKGIISGRTS